VKCICVDMSLHSSFIFIVDASLSLHNNGLARDLKIQISCLDTNDGLEI
jgi:hypothetical protein